MRIQDFRCGGMLGYDCANFFKKAHKIEKMLVFRGVVTPLNPPMDRYDYTFEVPLLRIAGRRQGSRAIYEVLSVT